MAAAGTFLTGAAPAGSNTQAVPSWLRGYEKQYARDPHAAALEWFRQAKFGLFMHYGLYSLPGRGAWIMYRENIPIADYTRLKDKFRAEKFDTDFITDLALEAEMKYVNITTMHHDGFCLFRTKQTDFNSLNSAAHRDLVGELAEQCHKKGLGLCFYYSHGRNWRHPDTMTNEKYGKSARPHYPKPDPHYHTGSDYNIERYVEYCNAQVKELLTQYGPVTNMWFDGVGTTVAGPWQKELHIPEMYALIRRLQPQCLISYKTGVTGTEDFLAPEYHWLEKRGPEFRESVRKSGKPIELCVAIAGWSYRKANDGKHRGADSVMENVAYAAGYDANLLLDIAPRPDGSIDPQDVATLREVGRRLRADGWPRAGA